MDRAIDKTMRRADKSYKKREGDRHSSRALEKRIHFPKCIENWQLGFLSDKTQSPPECYLSSQWDFCGI